MDIALSIMVICGSIFALASGKTDTVAADVLSSGEMALSTVISLLGGLMLFGGVSRILEEAGTVQCLVRAVKTPLKMLLGKEATDEALGAAAMNLSANMMGMGNAATPMGLRAAKLLTKAGDVYASHALCMLLIINATSVQLYPSTVIALRYAAGSAAPEAVVWPTMLASAAATVTGVAVGKVCERRLPKW